MAYKVQLDAYYTGNRVQKENSRYRKENLISGELNNKSKY